MNWEKEAARAANYVYEKMFSAHRGAMRWQAEDVVLVFGNDGYKTDGDDGSRPRREVELVRQFLAVKNATVLGFAVAENYSWAMLIKGAETNVMLAAVWHAWCLACNGKTFSDWGTASADFTVPAQAGIADLAIADHSPPVYGSMN